MRRSSFPIIAALLAATTIGCRKADTTAKKSDSAVAQQAGTATATPNVVTVSAKEYAFTAPAQIPAGVTTFQFTNAGTMFHHMQLVRIDSGKTFADLQAALKNPGPPPRWAVFVGGPNAPNPGGGQSNATLDLTAGHYAVLCLVDMPGGVPHFAKGMMQPLEVTAGASAAKAPMSDVTVKLADYGFQFSAPLTAGKHTFTVSNSATQPHEIEVVQLAPGKTAKDMLNWIMKMDGPPPGSAVGGVAALVPGATAEFSAELVKGNYAFICFIPDAKDGKPHFTHGMVHEEKVS